MTQHSFFLLAMVCSLFTRRFADASSAFFGGANHAEYLDWLETTPSYSHSAFFPSLDDADSGVAVHWTITDNDTIRLGVAARATGWVGFGISEAGGMKGSDIILFSSATEELVDSYVLGTNGMPLRDAMQSWQLEASFVGDEFIIFAASRAIDSIDTQDRRLLNDKEPFIAATRVIGAWGDTASPSFHGNNYAKGALRFFADSGSSDLLEDFRMAMNAQAEGKVRLTETDYEIPGRTTTYAEHCFDASDLVAANPALNGNALHIIGVEAFIDPRAAPRVHHFLLYGSTKRNCNEQITESQELLYTWAPGALPLQLPSNVGMPLGGDTGYASFRLQIHYDNPSNLFGILDSSGVYAYFTSQLRDFDMGVLQVGDPFVQASPNLISATGGLTQHSFECGGTCTQSYFQDEVTVFGEGLHMHKNGKMASSEVLRNNVVVHSAVSEYFDFDQQGGIVIQQEPYQLQRGDGFRVICSYDADPGERWGLSSDDEMCIAYLYYYPRQTLTVAGFQTQPGCGVSVDLLLPGCGAEHVITPDFESFDRVFGSSSTGQSPFAAIIAWILDILELLLAST